MAILRNYRMDLLLLTPSYPPIYSARLPECRASSGNPHVSIAGYEVKKADGVALVGERALESAVCPPNARRSLCRRHLLTVMVVFHDPRIEYWEMLLE